MQAQAGMNEELCYRMLRVSGLTRGGLAEQSKAVDWSVHRIAREFSGEYSLDFSMGESLAVVFPRWLDYVREMEKLPIHKWANEVMETSSVPDAIQKLKNLFLLWKMPATFLDTEKRNEAERCDLSKLAARVLLSEGNDTPGERCLNEQEIYQIMLACMKQ